MPSNYRIELSSSNRAGCKDTVCKAQGEKIAKGELRFGSWVEVKDHGSWAWKHWGCVSGKQIRGLRDSIENPDGTFDYEMIDGYDELGDYPELQEKIRRVVTQGHIDDEDFNGDLSMNQLGKVGIREKVPKAKKAAQEDGDEAEGSDEKPKSGKAAAGKKRKVAAAEVDDDEEPEAKKTKTSAATKGGKRGGRKAEESEDMDDEAEVKPEVAKKAVKPTGRGRGRVKKEAEEADDLREPQEEAKFEPEVAKKAAKATGRGRVRVKKEDEDMDDEPVVEPEVAKKAAKANGRGRVRVKKEDEDMNDEPVVEPEVAIGVAIEIGVAKKAAKTTGRGQGRVKKEADDDDEAQEEAECKPVPAPKKAVPKGKRGAKKAIEPGPESSDLPDDDEGFEEPEEDEEGGSEFESSQSKKKKKGGTKKSAAKGKKSK